MGVKLSKKSKKPIFKQIIDLIPQNLFRNSVQKYQTDTARLLSDELVGTICRYEYINATILDCF